MERSQDNADPYEIAPVARRVDLEPVRVFESRFDSLIMH
jgi:hypothetical protein